MPDPTTSVAGCLRPGADHRLTTAAPSDVRAAADVLAVAFADYPWTAWTVPAENHADRLRGLFDVTVRRVGVPFGETWLARCPGRGDVVGVVVALRPDRAVPSEVWDAAAADEAPLLGGRAPAAAEAEALCRPLRPDRPNVLVATLGVLPDHQRQGIASRLLSAVTRSADELGVPTYLETSSPGNVALYRRLGFVITGEVALAQDGPRVWGMRRDP